MDYLAHYLDKVQPLLDQSAMLLEMKKDFEEKWSQSQFPGWKVGLLPFGPHEIDTCTKMYSVHHSCVLQLKYDHSISSSSLH